MNSKIKKLATIVCAGVLALSSLTACSNGNTEPTISMTDDENAIRTRLVEALNQTETNTSFVVSASHQFTMRMQNSMNGVQIPTTVNSIYTGTFKYNKDVGVLITTENDMTVTATDTMGEHAETQSVKNSYIDCYDARDGWYYFSKSGDETQWYMTKANPIQMVDDLFNAASAANCNYTMMETADSIQITQPVADLMRDENFVNTRKANELVMNSISEYSSLCCVMTDGTITYTISKNTGNITCVEIKNVNISNGSASQIIDGNSNDFVIGNNTITANMKWVLSNFNSVTEADIMIHRERMNSAIEYNEPEPSQETQETQKDESIVILPEAGASGVWGTYDLVKMTTKKDDLTVAMLNSFSMDGTNHTFPFDVKILTDAGWGYREYDAENGYFVFKNETTFPNVTLAVFGSQGATEPESLYESGVSALTVLVTDVYKEDASCAKAKCPLFTFTTQNIQFGDSAESVLEKFGKPDLTTIGTEYDTYYYALYETEGITQEKHIVASLSVTIYHTDSFTGVTGVGIQYFTQTATEGDASEPTETTKASAKKPTTKSTKKSTKKKK